MLWFFSVMRDPSRSWSTVEPKQQTAATKKKLSKVSLKTHTCTDSKISPTLASRNAATGLGVAACLSSFNFTTASRKVLKHVHTSVGLDLLELGEKLREVVLLMEVDGALVLHCVSEIAIPGQERLSQERAGRGPRETWMAVDRVVRPWCTRPSHMS